MFLFLPFMVFLLQNQRTGGQNTFCPRVGRRWFGTGGRKEVAEKGVGE
jgi:hypothetical protein